MLTALLTACSDGGKTDAMTDASPQEKIAELAKRPVIDTVLARYENVRTEIRQRLIEEVGMPDDWYQPYSESETPCSRPYSKIGDAIAIQMAGWANDARIAEDRWDRAQELFTEITRRYGFGDPHVVVDRPTKHEIRVYDDHGGSIMLGTEVATILSSRTDCHLIPRAHPGKDHK
ncbi:LppA family lipoprotein [Saccharomonospora iraqiensis]|uniref:LppA family lipoprotein n=1 Tax=Saccharomonospora iraqiensis TaxID=52698 RepID=UPI0009FD5552|nr:LppA family lipoprotein [Saccharomonospora iraqiensis]